MSAIETIHASTIAINGRAVMIAGPSGSGKSDLALRLIDRGAMLVSDDYTEVAIEDGVIWVSPPATIAGRIEVRGLGIMTVPHVSRAALALAVRLADVVERMPQPSFRHVAGREIPEIAVQPFYASAPIKIEMALLDIAR